MARTAIYSGRTWRYTDVSVVLSLPTPIRAGDTPVYYPQVTNPDGYTIERIRAVNLSGTALTAWYSDGEPYELTALTAVSEGTEYLVFQIDTTEGGVLTSATVPVTILPALSALTFGAGTFGIGGTAPVFSGGGTSLTFGAGTFTANAGTGPTLVPAAASITFGAGVFVANAGTGPTLSGTPTTVNNSVSVSPNPADYNRDQVTLTCTLNPGSPTPSEVYFYRDYVSASDYGTLIGMGTQQSALVWTFTSYLDFDDYNDVRSVVNNFGAFTPSFNEINFSVRPLFLGKGTFTANAGTGPSLSAGGAAGTLTVGAGTFTANAGTGPTLTAGGSGITFGAGTFTANAGTEPTLTPAATSITFGAGTFTANAGTGPTLTPAATSITFGAGTFTANAGTGPTLSAASTFTSRWARGLNSNKARLSSTLTASHNFSGNTAVCMWRFIPQSLGGAVDYIVDWGFDPSGNEGWAARTDASDRLVIRVGYTSGEYNLGPTSAMSTGTTYLCSVYIVDGTVYFRVNGSEIGNSSNGITDPSTYSTIRIFSKNNGGGDALQADFQKFLVLQGGYSGTPATALTEVRADIATYEALAATSELSSASFTGTVVQRNECDESSDTSTSTPRVDDSGNSNDFADQYEDFGDQQWIASVDNSAL